MASLDAKTFASINGDAGGTWAPSSQLTIGGAGAQIRLVGTSNLDGIVSVNSGAFLNVQLGAIANFYCPVIFRSGSASDVRNGATWIFESGSDCAFMAGAGLTFNNTVTAASTSSWTFNGPVGFASTAAASFSGTVDMSGPYVFIGSAATTVNGNLTAAGVTSLGTTSINNTLTITGSNPISCAPQLKMFGGSILYDKMIQSGAGRLVKRYTFISSTGASTAIYGPVNTDRVIVNALTASVDFTINSSAAQDGDEIIFVNKSTTFFLNIYDAGTGIILALKQASGFDKSATFYYHTSGWELLTSARVP